MEIEEAVFYCVLGVVCVAFALTFERVRSAGAKALLLISLLVLIVVGARVGHRFLREHFETATSAAKNVLYVCSSTLSGSNVCAKPSEVDISNGMTLDLLAQLPVEPCVVYNTVNIEDCDAGLYDHHRYELDAMRKDLENTGANPELLAGINRVLSDTTVSDGGACKLQMGNWVRPIHSTFPDLSTLSSESGQRGNPLHWAYCYSPILDGTSSDKLNALLAKNAAANGSRTVLRTEDPETYTLKTGVHARVEFATLNPTAMTKTFCALFDPMADAKLASYYTLFSNPAFQSFIGAKVMDMNMFVQSFTAYKWNDGALVSVGNASGANELVDVRSCRSDLTKRSATFGTATYPSSEEQINSDHAFYCGDSAFVRKDFPYRIALRNLFMEVVEGGKLWLELKPNVTVYKILFNACGKAASIDTMTVPTDTLFPRAINRRNMIAQSKATSNDICEDNKKKRQAMCELLQDVILTYRSLMDTKARLREQAAAYVAVSQPTIVAPVTTQPAGSTTTGAAASRSTKKSGTVMAPVTQRTNPEFDKLSKQLTDYEKQMLTHRTNIATLQKTLDDSEMTLMLIEEKTNKVVDELRTLIIGKQLPIPAQYISSDGIVYFQPVEPPPVAADERDRADRGGGRPEDALRASREDIDRLQRSMDERLGPRA